MMTVTRKKEYASVRLEKEPALTAHCALTRNVSVVTFQPVKILKLHCPDSLAVLVAVSPLDLEAQGFLLEVDLVVFCFVWVKAFLTIHQTM